MIHFRIDIFGWRRVRELYDEVEQKESEIWALKKGEHFHEVQRKGWGKDFERLLKEQAELKAKIQALTEDRDEWIRKYKLSEAARQDLGDKLVKAARDNARLEQALDVIRGPLRQKGIDERAAEGGGPYGVQPGVDFDIQKGRTVL